MVAYVSNTERRLRFIHLFVSAAASSLQHSQRLVCGEFCLIPTMIDAAGTSFISQHKTMFAASLFMAAVINRKRRFIAFLERDIDALQCRPVARLLAQLFFLETRLLSIEERHLLLWRRDSAAESLATRSR